MSGMILLDYNNVLIRSIYANQSLYFDGIGFTGGFYGVLLQLMSVIKESPDINYLVVCRDKRPYLRSDYFPGYKSKRPEQSDDFKQKYKTSDNLCKEFFKFAGIPIISIDGFEADDLIALILMLEYANRYICMSTDSDLYQLFFNRSFEMYKGSKKGFYKKRDFQDEFDLHNFNPRCWARVCALAGGHNDLEGIKGVGIKTAIKIIKDKKKFESVKIKNKELYNNNINLTILPFGDDNFIYEQVGIVDNKLCDFEKHRDPSKMKVFSLIKKVGFESLVGNISSVLKLNDMRYL